MVDGHREDETRALAHVLDPETGEMEEFVWLFHRGPGGPLIGFGVAGAFDWPVEDAPDHVNIWGEPRFDVPTLALRNASIGEIVLAAQSTIEGSTPDVDYFDAAVEARVEDDDLELAADFWRSCLATGDMRAHYGLGYTLCDLGRPREGFGHLVMYTEICPRNSWAWCWRGRAAEAMGEIEEARECYLRAIECEEAGGLETDADELLATLAEEDGV